MRRTSEVLEAEATDEDLAPARPRRKPGPRPRKNPTTTAVADGDTVTNDGSLILATLERSERARLILSLGAFNGSPRVDLRNWRSGIRGVDTFVPTIKGCQLLAGDLDEAIAGLQRARELIAAAEKGESDG